MESSFPLSRRFARGPLALLLAAGISVGLPVDVAAQVADPFADGAEYRARADQPYPANAHRRKSAKAGWVVLAIGGTALSLAGMAMAGAASITFTVLELPYDAESRTHLRTCCIEQAFLAPGFLGMAGGGWMLGYGADRAIHGDWQSHDANSQSLDSRAALIFGGALLGTAAALYVVSGILTAAMFSEVVQGPYGRYSLTKAGERLPSAILGTMVPGMILAFPGGVVTGVYLNRYLQERKQPGQTAASVRGATDVMLAPMLSREVYGLQGSGRF